MIYRVVHNNVLVKRHRILLLKPFFILLLFSIAAGIIFAVAFFLKEQLPYSVLMYVFLPAALLVLHIGFAKFILEVIIYNNNRVIITPTKLIILKCSLFLKEDIEITNLEEVIKLTMAKHGIIRYILNFGNIHVEAQNDNIRCIHCIKDPHKMIKIIEKRKSELLS